jgi:hypothetical protein
MVGLLLFNDLSYRARRNQRRQQNKDANGLLLSTATFITLLLLLLFKPVLKQRKNKYCLRNTKIVCSTAEEKSS